MKTVLMGLAGLGMLVFGAGANASPLSTGTNLAAPDTGASGFVEQVRWHHRSYHRHYRSHRHYYRHHRRWR
ncbi:hypothetical protein PY365_28740 [Roseiarcaceae bacterium H3SJ34-1]|uniref:hypothetical protein n=1 Tax=Terripilifer ovatus TaxID=3032367 RepID=UPI003AB946D2|nr:hypothetical protein [Roseiarcaceae bacterium H3SJ34-1]